MKKVLSIVLLVVSLVVSCNDSNSAGNDTIYYTAEQAHYQRLLINKLVDVILEYDNAVIYNEDGVAVGVDPTKLRKAKDDRDVQVTMQFVKYAISLGYWEDTVNEWEYYSDMDKIMITKQWNSMWNNCYYEMINDEGATCTDCVDLRGE